MIPLSVPTDSPVPANAGAQLAKLYVEYRAFVEGGSQGPFTSSLSSILSIQGSRVGVDVRGKVDVAIFSSELTSLGMEIRATEPLTKTVEGSLPIDQIPAVASLPTTVSVLPILKPMRC